ncbi:hypothetical protein MNEG_16574 [Monoraphidium neglectum]|uniref:Uncharacterized protein n=1 Tax=Monoraphidium neglectum TaxID=145388 RepID=A0A0D2M7C8_9CHLO|nr:hypothetical protein MNEG_16574 [Monoraphidium neglectum]KIY91390.1 hypothetical protein MNEG_16574 [Monoraphidium neglectum]|eukprot:XP_013890410.1 hypothetical protein MNEG_16574 [Monoraphidium neglectum]
MRDKVAEIDGAHKEKQAQLKAVQGRLGQLRKSQGLLEQRERLELAAVWAVVREREEELASIDAKLGSMRSSKRGQLEEQAARLDERLDALSRERSELVGSPL